MWFKGIENNKNMLKCGWEKKTDKGFKFGHIYAEALKDTVFTLVFICTIVSGGVSVCLLSASLVCIFST